VDTGVRLYFGKLKLWYQICSLDDEIIGPLTLQGGANFSVQECHNASHLKAKKFSTYAKEEICIVYLLLLLQPHQ